MNRFSDEDYAILNESPRFVEVTVSFLGKVIKAPDAASLLYLNKELFGTRIYNFKTHNNYPFVIDCGANIGLSVIFFKNLYPNADILAFEPDKKLYEYLTYNLNSFEINDVNVINKGLWSKQATLDFFEEGADGGRLAKKTDTSKIIQIETVTLSSYLKEKRVDFLKIDIEGAETEVLKECQSDLRMVDNIFIEYHSDIEGPQTLDCILNILSRSGFRYYIDRGGVKSSSPFLSINKISGFDNQLNIYGYRE